MKKETLQEANQVLTRNRRRCVWKRIVCTLACVVVFCTTYALILPAITFEKAPKCGKTEHIHSGDCFQTVAESTNINTLICNLEEHAHSAACSVIGPIEKLPDKQSVEERMTAFGKVGDEAGSDAYLTKLQMQVQEAYEAYAALPKDEQAKVTNSDRLTALDWLRGLSLQETTSVTITNVDSSIANSTLWTDDTGVTQKRLQAALFSIDHGYAIRSIECYQITGLTGNKATVTYNSGSGLSAANDDSQVFVYDLGTDGAAVPQRCAVENATQENGLFTSFSFIISAGSESAPHIYAFISASPATLEEMGIYLGTDQFDGTWVAYDAASEADAGVKVTVTLPEGMTAPDGYSLFIRKINEGENYYPTNEVVIAEAGEVNDWQCYTIRWIKQDETGNLSMLPLNRIGTATIRIEYLNEDARLLGPAGARKLLIYNSNRDGSLVDQVADTVQNVQVTDDGYTSFTFQAAQAGPYVFVSKKLEMGYIDSLQIKNIIDGSDPFDNTDTPGNDSSKSNRIVRSYDTVQYTLEATFGARQEGVTANEVDMYFELTLRKSATAARFDVSKMLWLGENYSIEYLDANGNVIMILAHDGKYYLPQTDENGSVIRNSHGFALPDTGRPTVSMNAYVSGSTAGENSYKLTSGGVAMQRLVGWTKLRANDGESILSGTQSFSTAIEVRNADNGEIFSPAFRMWLEGNEDNYGPEGTAGEDMLPAQPDGDNIIDVNKPENEQYRVKVSAGTNFNIQLKKNADMSYKNWFDFSTGNLVEKTTRDELVRLAKLEENHGKSNPAEFTEDGVALSANLQAEYANYRYGRITCYGITLQLYNYTDNKPEVNLNTKGIRGFSLPVGNITFDLNFSSAVNSEDSSVSSGEYTAILWDYNENIPADTTYSYPYVDPGRGMLRTPNDGRGNGGRTLYWDGETRSAFAKGGAPSNYIVYHDGCYYGGDWALVNESGNPVGNINTIANPQVVTGTGGDTTYHFSVSDYDFDFDNQHFPTRDAGNSGNVPGYDTYARGFSAGCVQVLSVFPMVQRVSEAEIFLNTTVSNLHLTTRAGQELSAQAGDNTKIGHEVNTKDNTKRDQIVLYAPGGLTKGNSFNGMHHNNPPKTTTDGYLGTEYWTTSYDCSTFAGDDIWLMSYGMMSSGGDYRMRSMNLLQLFDSRALSIRGNPDVCQNWDPKFDEKGNATFLYAADPDYPDGYDTNHKDGNNQYDVLAYMNTVREEDLRYFTSLKDLEDAGYTCVVVLMELRNCDLLGGKYQYMRIPIKVNGDDEDLVGKTVATVNTFRVWSENLGDITWADGVWDNNTGKNVLSGFPKPKNYVVNDEYSGELANGAKSPPYYVKTEYENGLQVHGTHVGGTLSGNSLLILSYKAGINIGVDNKASTGMISYNIGNGETVVDYRLKNIRTEISDPTGQTEYPPTTLTIHAVLDEGYTGDTQRISVSGGSYRIMGYAVDANGNVADEETSISIGTDPDHPTELEFEGSDRERHRIKIYAQLGANSRSLTFVIQDAPVGLYLPDITFQANFAAVTALSNNDTIKTSTYISGQGDNRAYDQAKGNTDNVTVGVVLSSGTNLTKAVSTRYIELDGVITYYVTYTNSGTDRINKIYFYDLLPHAGDIRGSMFEGDVVLRSVDVISSRGDDAPPANATVYYSNMEYWQLYNMVKVFGGSEDPTNGKISGMDESVVEQMLLDEKKFKPLGRVNSNGEFEYDSAFSEMSEDGITELMSKVTGLYVKVENLYKGQTVEMSFTVETEGNKADDWYKNIANSWIAGSATLPLTSNKVETQSVSRIISGVVWYDRNLNGIRDDGEQLLEGVTVTLLKKNDAGDYEPCTSEVTGGSISPITTGPDGVYSFGKLAAGDYIVAFSGDVLEKFTGATVYQQNGQNDANTNDGIAVANGKNEPIDSNAYAYYIKYSVDSVGMPLHSLDQMGTVSLINGVEMYANQDLGLIIATHELPETGGNGTTRYTAGGALLIACVGISLLYIYQKRRKEASASS